MVFSSFTPSKWWGSKLFSLFLPKQNFVDRYTQIIERFGDLHWLFMFTFLFLKMRTRGARREKFGIFLNSDLEFCFLPVIWLIILEEPKRLTRITCILTQCGLWMPQDPIWETFSIHTHWILLSYKKNKILPFVTT